MTAVVARQPVVLACPLQPETEDGAAKFYRALDAELGRILRALGGAHASSSATFNRQDRQVEDPALVEILDGAQRLEAEVSTLWRLDSSILRTAGASSLLDAPPMLAPGPAVTGPGSAAVRLKQLRAAFVARSQQVNMAHNQYKCLSKHNDLYKTYVRVSVDANSPTSTVVPHDAFSLQTSSYSDVSTQEPQNVHMSSISRASSFAGSDFGSTPPVTDAFAAADESAELEPSPPDGGCPWVLRRTLSVPGKAPVSSSGDSNESAGSPPPLPFSPPKRRGFLGSLFGRGRSQPEAEIVAEQVPATIEEDVMGELRRSLSEPATNSPRAALELSRDSSFVASRRGGFAMEDVGECSGSSRLAGIYGRRSRDMNRRSGETLRVRSEPAPLSRDQRRRRGFALMEAEYEDHFSNGDLDNRASLFNSAADLQATEMCAGTFRRR